MAAAVAAAACVKAWHQQEVMEWHPDRRPRDESPEDTAAALQRFTDIQHAWKVAQKLGAAAQLGYLGVQFLEKFGDSIRLARQYRAQRKEVEASPPDRTREDWRVWEQEARKHHRALHELRRMECQYQARADLAHTHICSKMEEFGKDWDETNSAEPIILGVQEDVVETVVQNNTNTMEKEAKGLRDDRTWSQRGYSIWMDLFTGWFDDEAP